MRTLLRIFKYAVYSVLCVELVATLFTVGLNLVMYGNTVDLHRTVYDAYSLFTLKGDERPTLGNKRNPDPRLTADVWVYGGSTLLCSTDNEPPHTVVSYLAQELNRDPAQGFNAFLTNRGMFGYNSLLEIKCLEKDLVRRHPWPDMLVFYDGVNDTTNAVEFLKEDSHWGYDKTAGLVESAGNRWKALIRPLVAGFYNSYSRELYLRFFLAFRRLDENDPRLDAIAREVEKRYDMVQKLADSAGIPFKLFWQPMFWTEECGTGNPYLAEELKGQNKDRLEALHHNFSAMNRAITKRIKDKPYFVDMRSMLCPRTEKIYWADGVHLYNQGNQMVARTLLPYVQKALKARLENQARSSVLDILSGPAPAGVDFASFDEATGQAPALSRLARGPKASVTFTSPRAGKCRLRLDGFVQKDGQRMAVSLNGALLDSFDPARRGQEIIQDYFPDVRQGVNVLEFTFPDDASQAAPDKAAPGFSFTELRAAWL